MAPRRKKTTPIRGALAKDSSLRAEIQDGIGAVKPSHRKYLASDVRRAFADSLDLDAALQGQHPQENRWDYLLGHEVSVEVIGVEPHSAKQDEISTVIKKKEAAKIQLSTHLAPGKRVSKWLWVASGKVHFANTEKARYRLDQCGIEFIGGRVLAKHLPGGKG